MRVLAFSSGRRVGEGPRTRFSHFDHGIGSATLSLSHIRNPLLSSPNIVLFCAVCSLCAYVCRTCDISGLFGSWKLWVGVCVAILFFLKLLRDALSVRRETVLVIRGLGLQLERVNSLGFRMSCDFVPLREIEDVVLNEGIIKSHFAYYVAVMVLLEPKELADALSSLDAPSEKIEFSLRRQHTKAVLPFSHFLPRLHVALYVLQVIRRVLYSEGQTPTFPPDPFLTPKTRKKMEKEDKPRLVSLVH